MIQNINMLLEEKNLKQQTKNNNHFINFINYAVLPILS